MPWDEFSWAVGIFEGEGSVGVHSAGVGQQRVPVMQLVMTDEDTVLRFHRAVGRGHVSGPREYKNSKKPLWQWRLATHRGIHDLLGRMLPYLGERRRTRSFEVLQWIEGRPRWKWPTDQMELGA